MPYLQKIPAQINILGNPSDANECDFATISAAVDLYAYATIEQTEGILIEQIDKQGADEKLLAPQEFTTDIIPLYYDGELDLIKGAINHLWIYSPEFRDKMKLSSFKISTWTDVPRQSGLGGSTLFILLTLCGLRAIYDLDPLLNNDYVIGELTQRTESFELGIVCGFADRYVPLIGGIAYLDYRGKLHKIPLHEEPYVTYEKLDSWVDGLSLVAATSGIMHNSGDVHGKMRPRYISEYDS